MQKPLLPIWVSTDSLFEEKLPFQSSPKCWISNWITWSPPPWKFLPLRSHHDHSTGVTLRQTRGKPRAGNGEKSSLPSFRGSMILLINHRENGGGTLGMRAPTGDILHINWFSRRISGCHQQHYKPKTRHSLVGNTSHLPYICIVWFPKKWVT